MEHVSQPVETKTRRLAPQFALTKEELASDNSKSKIPSEIKKPSQNIQLILMFRDRFNTILF